MGARTPPVWLNCQISTGKLRSRPTRKARASELVDRTDRLPASDGSTAKAYEREEGWLGYYWALTAILGQLRDRSIRASMTKEQGHVYRGTRLRRSGSRTVGRNPKFCVVTNEFAEKSRGRLTSAAPVDNPTVNKLLAWMAEEQATGEEAAFHFSKSSEVRPRRCRT
jgi:glycine betaine/proline transport system substrate-binding protein